MLRRSGDRNRLLRLAPAVLLSFVGTGEVAGQVEAPAAEPSTTLTATATAAAATRAQTPSLSALAFMAGCWEGSFNARDGSVGVIEEQYTSPSDNVMLGTTRYLLGAATVQFELTSIVRDDDGIVLLPYPGGRPSADGFRLTGTGDGVATFEAPEHDFPRRIRYRVSGPEGLVARVDDGTDDGQAQEWRLERRACPGP